MATGAREIRVTLPDNRELPATIVGIDPMTDLAVVKVDATGLTPLPWGDSGKLRLAEWVLAVGNPFALSRSVTLGIVSALKRPSPDPTLSVYTDFIQTDAAINPGNSGGALVNSRGELVGINSAIYSGTGGYQGIGFAIPANLAQRIMKELIAYGEVKWGAIDGMDVQDLTPDLASQLQLKQTRGPLVYRTWRGSAADQAGVQPGDLIVAVDGQSVDDATHFERMVADAPVGSKLKLSLLRSGKQVTVSVPVVQAQPPRRRSR